MGAVESVAKNIIVRPCESVVRTVSDVLETVGDVTSTVVKTAVPFLHHRKVLESLAELVGQKPKRGVPISQKIQEVTEKTVEQLGKDAQAELGMDAVNCFNFGFAGNSGTGKSSLINALRGLKDSDEGAAMVDETECTSDIRKYVHPGNPHMVFWDIPGGGTLRHSSSSYFMDKKLYAFDMIIIIGSERFTELDVAIASAAKSFDVPILFVRSKSDSAIESRSRRLKIATREAKEDVRAEIISDIYNQLPEDLRNKKIFVISSRVYGGVREGFDPEDYSLDETELLQQILATAQNRME